MIAFRVSLSSLCETQLQLINFLITYYVHLVLMMKMSSCFDSHWLRKRSEDYKTPAKNLEGSLWVVNFWSELMDCGHEATLRRQLFAEDGTNKNEIYDF